MKNRFLSTVYIGWNEDFCGAVILFVAIVTDQLQNLFSLFIYLNSYITVISPKESHNSLGLFRHVTFTLPHSFHPVRTFPCSFLLNKMSQNERKSFQNWIYFLSFTFHPPLSPLSPPFEHPNEVYGSVCVCSASCGSLGKFLGLLRGVAHFPRYTSFICGCSRRRWVRRGGGPLWRIWSATGVQSLSQSTVGPGRVPLSNVIIFLVLQISFHLRRASAAKSVKPPPCRKLWEPCCGRRGGPWPSIEKGRKIATTLSDEPKLSTRTTAAKEKYFISK